MQLFIIITTTTTTRPKRLKPDIMETQTTTAIDAWTINGDRDMDNIERIDMEL